MAFLNCASNGETALRRRATLFAGALASSATGAGVGVAARLSVRARKRAMSGAATAASGLKILRRVSLLQRCRRGGARVPAAVAQALLLPPRALVAARLHRRREHGRASGPRGRRLKTGHAVS
jgi:hypothetical protein